MSSFTAEVHESYICDILASFYGIEVQTWLTNQTADSVSSNLKLARFLGVPHINCENYLLNNEVKYQLNSSTPNNQITNMRELGPGFVCSNIHETMISLETNKNRACLREHTDLTPTIGYVTGWTGNSAMMK